MIGSALPPAALSAFNSIKSAISSQPVLAYPSPSGDLTLAVDSAQGDANNQGGMGAALLQRQSDGSNKPIGYASRQLLTYERNYPAFLLEMAAAVFGMDYFHHYLVGRPFQLLTDHKPLVPLSTIHTRTLNRLQLKMQELHPTLAHIPGKDNVIPDFLSRYSGMGIRPASPPTAPPAETVASVDISPAALRPLQSDDKLCKSVKRLPPPSSS